MVIGGGGRGEVLIYREGEGGSELTCKWILVIVEESIYKIMPCIFRTHKKVHLFTKYRYLRERGGGEDNVQYLVIT